MDTLSVELQSENHAYNRGTTGFLQGHLRPLLASRVTNLPLVRAIGRTMVQGKNYGPQITVKRLAVRRVNRDLKQY